MGFSLNGLMSGLGNLLGSNNSGGNNILSGANTMSNDFSYNMPKQTQGILGGMFDGLNMDNAFSDGNGGMGWATGGLKGLGDIAGAYGAIQKVNLGRDQMNMQKAAYNNNAMMQQKANENRYRDMMYGDTGGNVDEAKLAEMLNKRDLGFNKL